MVGPLRGHVPVPQPPHLSVQDVQSLPNVVREVLGRIAGLREEEMSNAICHPSSMQARAASLVSPPSCISARMSNPEIQVCLGAPRLHTTPTILRLIMAMTPVSRGGDALLLHGAMESSRSTAYQLDAGP